LNKTESRTLVILNYAMDLQDSIFSHQVEAVIRLSPFFPKVVVVTSKSGEYQVPDNVTVKSSEWKRGRPISNLLNLLRVCLPILRQNTVVFSHMTDVQSAILSPITRILGIRHYLWYAHTSHSIYLRWANLWVNSVVTSTAGSCPITSHKVIAVGQAINPEIFSFNKRNGGKLVAGVHIGRLDQSKRIEMLIQECEKIRHLGYPVTFCQIGSPSIKEFSNYQNLIQDKARNLKWVEIQNSISRDKLPIILQAKDFFIHAFDGSLDKSLVEATMCGLPVLTTNKEYLREIGSWTGDLSSTLSEQYLFLTRMNRGKLQDELVRRQKLCLEFHSISHWQSELSQLLRA